jgi:hypothetical protein
MTVSIGHQCLRQCSFVPSCDATSKRLFPVLEARDLITLFNPRERRVREIRAIALRRFTKSSSSSPSSGFAHRWQPWSLNRLLSAWTIPSLREMETLPPLDSCVLLLALFRRPDTGKSLPYLINPYCL